MVQSMKIVNVIQGVNQQVNLWAKRFTTKTLHSLEKRNSRKQLEWKVISWDNGGHMSFCQLAAALLRTILWLLTADHPAEEWRVRNWSQGASLLHRHVSSRMFVAYLYAWTFWCTKIMDPCIFGKFPHSVSQRRDLIVLSKDISRVKEHDKSDTVPPPPQKINMSPEKGPF